MINRKKIFYSLLFFIVFVSCKQHYVPKPMGYFRIDFPEKEYAMYQSDAPYQFDIPVYAKVSKDTDYNAEPYWLNIHFPEFKGSIHLSYKPVNDNLARYLEDSRTFVYKHTIKADAISEIPYINEEQNVYGILYEIKGNTASSLQFIVTDSTHHFLRGALYFNVHPNKDSLAPVIDFFKKDIEKLMETVKWVN